MEINDFLKNLSINFKQSLESFYHNNTEILQELLYEELAEKDLYGIEILEANYKVIGIDHQQNLIWQANFSAKITEDDEPTESIMQKMLIEAQEKNTEDYKNLFNYTTLMGKDKILIDNIIQNNKKPLTENIEASLIEYLQQKLSSAIYQHPITQLLDTPEVFELSNTLRSWPEKTRIAVLTQDGFLPGTIKNGNVYCSLIQTQWTSQNQPMIRALFPDEYGPHPDEDKPVFNSDDLEKMQNISSEKTPLEWPPAHVIEELKKSSAKHPKPISISRIILQSQPIGASITTTEHFVSNYTTKEPTIPMGCHLLSITTTLV